MRAIRVDKYSFFSNAIDCIGEVFGLVGGRITIVSCRIFEWGVF